MTAPTLRRRSTPATDHSTPDSSPGQSPRRQGRRSRPAVGHGFGLRMPTLRVAVGAEIVLAVIASTAVALGFSTQSILWAVLPLALLPFLVVAERSVLDWAATAIRYTSGTVPDVGVTCDHTESDGESFGVHWRGDRASCVLELRAPNGATTRLGREGALTDTSLDLTTLAQCLSQHDITLCSVDITSHGNRTASGSSATDVYEQLIGPLPAVSTRTVWVTVSIDVRANREAADLRGDGRTGASRTVGIATMRVARALEARGIHSRRLMSTDIRAAASHMCRGVAPDALTESWRSAPLPGVIDSGFGFDCRRIDDEVLAEVWSVPALSTTVVLRLTPSSVRGRVKVSGSCRFITRTSMPAPRLPAAVSMNGRHREGLLTSLPLAISAPGYDAPVRDLEYGHLQDLHIPTSGCGQLLGSDVGGHGIAARIHGFGLNTVLVAGELYLAQQLVFRAIATGARILIRTDRPHAWGPLVDSVAVPDRLRIEGGPHRPNTRFDVVVQDYSDSAIEPTPARTSGVTVITLTEHLPRTPMTDPDLTIVQPGAAGDRIQVRTGRHEIDLILVTISQETAFIGRPRSTRHSA